MMTPMTTTGTLSRASRFASLCRNVMAASPKTTHSRERGDQKPPLGTALVLGRCPTLATDTLRTYDEIVQIPFLCLRCSQVHVVLDEHGVPGEGAVTPHPVHVRLPGLETTVQPVLENAVRLAGVVQLRVDLDA